MSAIGERWETMESGVTKWEGKELEYESLMTVLLPSYAAFCFVAFHLSSTGIVSVATQTSLPSAPSELQASLTSQAVFINCEPKYGQVHDEYIQ